MSNRLSVHSQNRERLLGLDGARGLAAIAVVTMHYTVSYDRIIGHDASLVWRNPFGGLGVHVFFAISGFVILLTLDRSPSIGHFAVARFARLYPAYWVCGLLTWLAITVSGTSQFAIQPRAAMMNATMLAGFFSHPHIDPVYWTLEVELKFYVLMAILVGIGARRFVIHALIILVVADIANHFLHFTEWDGTGLWRLRVYLPLGYLYLFLVGLVFYESRPGWRPLHWLALALCTTALVLHNSPVRAGIVLSSLILLYAATRDRARWLQARPLVFLGTVSYSLYLIHQVNGYLLIAWLQSQHVEPNVAVAVTTGLALLAATTLVFSVERPCYQFIRARLTPRPQNNKESSSSHSERIQAEQKSNRDD